MANGLVDYGIIKPNVAADVIYQAEQRQNQKQQEARQNKLADLQLQTAEQEMADRNALRAASQADILANPMKYGKSGLEYAKTVRETKTAELNQAKTVLEMMKGAATQVMANPEQAETVLMDFGRRTGSDVSADLAQLRSLGGNREAIVKWAAGHALQADKLLPQYSNIDTQDRITRQGFDPLTGKPTGEMVIFTKGISPADQQRLATEQQRVGLEQQRLGLEGRRVAVAEQEAARKAATEGKPLTAAQEVKLRQDIGKDRKMLDSIESNSTSINTEIDRLLKHPGLGGITGYAGMLPTLPASEAGAAKNILEGIQGKVKALGRDIASQSGKLGNMAVQEWKFVADAVAALDPRSPDFKNQLQNIQSVMEGLKGRTRNQFEDTYAPYLEQRPELTQSNKAPVAPAAQAAAMYARNPETGERIMSLDGGNTWSPAR